MQIPEILPGYYLKKGISMVSFSSMSPIGGKLASSVPVKVARQAEIVQPMPHFCIGWNRSWFTPIWKVWKQVLPKGKASVRGGLTKMCDDVKLSELFHHRFSLCFVGRPNSHGGEVALLTFFAFFMF